MARKAHITLTLAALLLGCHGFDGRVVHEQLMGIWETATPRYAGCTLQVTRESIIFTSPVGSQDINAIRQIRGAEEAKGVLYDIDYENMEGGKFRLSLYYIRSGALEILRFKHQPGIEWVRKRHATPAPKG